MNWKIQNNKLAQTFKSSSVKGAQEGSTEAQNLLGVSFLMVDVFMISAGGNSSAAPSPLEIGFCWHIKKDMSMDLIK